MDIEKYFQRLKELQFLSQQEVQFPDEEDENDRDENDRDEKEEEEKEEEEKEEEERKEEERKVKYEKGKEIKIEQGKNIKEGGETVPMLQNIIRILVMLFLAYIIIRFVLGAWFALILFFIISAVFINFYLYSSN